MWAIVLLGLIFLSWIIAPFLPKERGGSPTVIHNSINIINNPSAPSQQEPKQTASEEGLFGADYGSNSYNNRMKF